MRKLHLYLSLPFGVLISLICFSGAMLVFEKDITSLVQSDRLRIHTTVKTPLPIDSLKLIVERNLPNGVKTTGVTINNDPECAYLFMLSKPKKAGVYVNQYTGEVLAAKERLPFFQTMFKLHRWLLGPSKADDGSIGWGRMLVGVSTIVFVLVLMSGVVVWWPRNKTVLLNSLKISFRGGFRAVNRKMHIVGGVYACLLLLIMALTGLTWSFGWYRNAVYAMFGSVESAKEEVVKLRSSARETVKVFNQSDISWDKVYRIVSEKCSDFKSIIISRNSANVSRGDLGNVRAVDQYVFDVASGELIQIDYYSQRDIKQKVRGWIYSLHTGSFGGFFTRVIWFLAAIIGATLPLSGYYIWWRKRAISRAKKSS